METRPDSLRPAFHFAPVRGWMNDPNGLVHFGGQWHLFYQYFEPEIVDGMMWGHAVAPDLVRWSHRPPALRPDALGQIWSGSAVVAPAGTAGTGAAGPSLACLYTYWDARDHRQSQGLATSVDGATFVKHPANPVVPQLRHLPGQPDEKDFRDPKVFRRGPAGPWVMAVAGGKLRTFVSGDLVRWEWAHTHAGLDTECPDLFPLAVDGDPERVRWVLSGGGRWYMWGDFDGRRFLPRGERRPFGGGPDWYATQTWSDAPDGRRVAISWLFDWKYGAGPKAGGIRNPFPTGPRAGGCLTVPCELSLAATPEGERLLVRPVAELDSLRGPLLVDGPAPRERLPGGPLDLEVGGGASWALDLPALGGGVYRLGYDAAAGVLGVDRTAAPVEGSPAFAGRHEVPVPGGGTGIFRVLLDRGSAEVFAPGGRAVLAAFLLRDPDALGGGPAFTVGAGAGHVRAWPRGPVWGGGGAGT